MSFDTISVLTDEEIDSSLTGFVHSRMQRILPLLSQMLADAASASKTTMSLEIFAASRDRTKWQVENYILPFLTKEFTKSASDPDPNDPRQTDLDESPTTTALHAATLLDLGVLTSVYPAALETLYELLDSPRLTVRTFAGLAITYANDVPSELDLLGLNFAIKTGMFFLIPLRLYAKILPGLKGYFQSDSTLTNSLVRQFSNTNGSFWHTYTRAETAIFLAELGIANEKVIAYLVDWADFFAGERQYYKTYMERCHEAAARLIETNASAMDVYVEKIATQAMEKPIVEVEGWLNALLKIDPNQAEDFVLERLFKIADLVVDGPAYHLMVVQAVVNFANMGNAEQKAKSLEWLLVRLNSEDPEILYRTLKGIWDLKDVTPSIEDKVIELAQYQQGLFDLDMRKLAALDTLSEWGLFDKRTLPIIEEAAKDQNSFLATKAQTILEVYKHGQDNK